MENAVLLARAETPSIPSQGLRNLVMWGGPIFLSAFLLFQVQPLLAKIILPWFGGGAGIWITSLVFFQITYLLGNLYAHWLIRYGSSRWGSLLHMALLAFSLLLLPILPAPAWKPTGSANPTLHIFGLLAATIGLPFLLLSTTSHFCRLGMREAAAGIGHTVFTRYQTRDRCWLC